MFRHKNISEILKPIPISSLYFSSPKISLIVGECKRYIRTNSCEEQYHSQLKCCHQKRGYPLDFINKYMQTIQYSKRPLLLQRHQPPIKIKTSPVFKCLPPLRHQHLTDIIFETSITSKNP